MADYAALAYASYIKTCPHIFRYPAFSVVLSTGSNGELQLTSPLISSMHLKTIEPPYVVHIGAKRHAYLLLVGWRIMDTDEPTERPSGFIFEGHLDYDVTDEVKEVIRRDMGLRRLLGVNRLVREARTLNNRVLQGGYGVCASLAFSFHILADRNPEASIETLILHISKIGMQMISHTLFMIHMHRKFFRRYYLHEYGTTRSIREWGVSQLMSAGVRLKYTDDFYTENEWLWMDELLGYIPFEQVHLLVKHFLASPDDFFKILTTYYDDKDIDEIRVRLGANTEDDIRKLQDEYDSRHQLIHHIVFNGLDDDIGEEKEDIDVDFQFSPCSMLMRDSCQKNPLCKTCGDQCINKKTEKCVNGKAFPAEEIFREAAHDAAGAGAGAGSAAGSDMDEIDD